MTAPDPLLIDLPRAIETQRLHLRPPRTGDGPVLHHALVDSLAQLRQFLGSLPWVGVEQTVETAETWCRNSEANFISRKDLPFLIFEKATGDLVGSTGLHRTVWATPRTEVGYWGRTTHARRGFVGEAVTAISNYAFEHIGAVRIELVTDEENVPSRKLAQRCGFKLEGTMKHSHRAPDGSLRSMCMYALFPRPAG